MAATCQRCVLWNLHFTPSMLDPFVKVGTLLWHSFVGPEVSDIDPSYAPETHDLLSTQLGSTSFEPSITTQSYPSCCIHLLIELFLQRFSRRRWFQTVRYW